MATLRWTGAAQDIRQEQTVTVSGTWAQGETGSLIINNKKLTITAGASVATTDIAAAINAAISAGSATENLVGDETRNFGGREIPEFREVVSTVSGSVVTLKSYVPGVPFTLTVSDTAASGALATSVTVAATGKNFADNAANYTGGVMPADNDNLVFDSGDVSVLYGLTYFRGSGIDLNITRTTDYSGQIGLPPQNNLGYVEYRQRYFQWRGYSKTFVVMRGQTVPATPRPMWLDVEGQTNCSVTIDAPLGSDPAVPSVFLAGGSNSCYPSLMAGNISIDPEDALGIAASEFADIRIGSPGIPTQPIVTFGQRCTINAVTQNFIQYGGDVTINCSLDGGGTYRNPVVYGGTLRLFGDGSAKELTAYKGGTISLSGSISGIDKVTLYGGTLDCSEASLVGAISPIDDINVYAGSTIKDKHGIYTDQFDLLGCSPADVTLELPANRKWVYDTTAS